MKLGNTSQSIIPVPDFFLTRTLREMDTFSISNQKKKYFKENELFRMTRDINLSNNPRNRHRKYEKYNREKFIPYHKVKEVIPNSNNKSQEKQDSIDSYEEINEKSDKYNPKDQSTKNYLIDYRTLLDKRSQELRDEIKNNIDHLMSKLNKKVDINKYMNYDCTENYYMANAEEFPELGLKPNENQTNKFNKILRDKMINISDTVGISKNRIIKEMIKKEESSNNLPYLVSKAAFENSIKSREGSRVNFYKTVKVDRIISGSKDEFYINRERKDKLHIDDDKYNCNKGRRIFSENFDHLDFLRKYNN